MSNLQSKNIPAFDCPSYPEEDDNNFKVTSCGTPYCSGASFFEPVWSENCWEYGWTCPCGCSNEIFICDNEEEGWWRA